MTWIILIITSAISVWAFSNRSVFEKMQLNPYQVYHRKQWYRIFSHGFIHADWVHLLVNMLVFLSFGVSVERIFGQLQEQDVISSPILYFLLLYFGGMALATVSSIAKHKDNHYYNSVGASGAVSAVIFASIFFRPWASLYLYAVIPIPGLIFGVIYLAYSQYMSKRGGDNINHDAHFIGAVYGFLFPLVMDPSLINVFISQLF